MSTTDATIRGQVVHEQVKQCCARLYESDLARFLLGDSFHPGGLALTGQLGRMIGLNPSDTLRWYCLLLSAIALDLLGNKKGDNGILARAIAVYRQLLQEYERERMPLLWALTQNKLGKALV